MDQQLAHRAPRYPRKGKPNALRVWLETEPVPMQKKRFAELVGVTASYVTQLISDNPPWPGRLIAQRIAIVTEGVVTPNDLAGYPPAD
jgi:DNA-binding transcriptional regulator YdaS (Cro superfamily)